MGPATDGLHSSAPRHKRGGGGECTISSTSEKKKKKKYVIVVFLTGLTRSAASQILHDLPESIVSVKRARLVQRDPKRFGDGARYGADELAVAIAVQEPNGRSQT